jgi:hypothetical protein
LKTRHNAAFFGGVANSDDGGGFLGSEHGFIAGAELLNLCSNLHQLNLLADYKNAQYRHGSPEAISSLFHVKFSSVLRIFVNRAG